MQHYWHATHPCFQVDPRNPTPRYTPYLTPPNAEGHMSWYTKVGLRKPDPYAHVPRSWVMGMAVNTGQPEHVLTTAQWRSLSQ